MKALAATLLCLLIAACATPTPSPTPPPAPTSTRTPIPTMTPTPSSSPSPAFSCYRDPIPKGPGSPSLPSSYCPAERVAVETAVEKLGRTIKAITIEATGFPCNLPFTEGYNMACFASSIGPVAYVSFVGTDHVAALTIALVVNGPVVAKIVTFEVPPSGWSMP